MSFDEAMRAPGWREMANILLKDAPKNCTRMFVRDYIMDLYSKKQIAKIYTIFFGYLDRMNEYDLQNSQEADDIRDASDVWWYAGEQESIEKEIKKYRDLKYDYLGDDNVID
jgi:hypothetical protein